MKFNNITELQTYCEGLSKPLCQFNIDIVEDILPECINNVCEFVDVKLAFISEAHASVALVSDKSVLYVSDLSTDNGVASFTIDESKFFSSCKVENDNIVTNLLIETDGQLKYHSFALKVCDEHHLNGTMTFAK